MTDLEFDIIDEMYFVISYNELESRLSMNREDLIDQLIEIFNRGWLRVFKSPDDTKDFEHVSKDILVNSYLLASKAGLKAHNS